MNKPYWAFGVGIFLCATLAFACSDDTQDQEPSTTSTTGSTGGTSQTGQGTTTSTSQTSETSQTSQDDVGLGDVEEGDADLTDADEPDVDEPDTMEPDVANPDASEPFECEGACQETEVTVNFGGTERTFTRAYFGFSPPERNGGPPVYYVEMYSGGMDGCPAEDSPTPDATIIVTAFDAIDGPQDAFPYQAEDPVVTLLDFEGALVPDVPPFSTATNASLNVQGAQLCVSCIGDSAPSQPESWVAFDLDATFEEGTAQGHAYATHCDSLDE